MLPKDTVTETRIEIANRDCQLALLEQLRIRLHELDLETLQNVPLWLAREVNEHAEEIRRIMDGLPPRKPDPPREPPSRPARSERRMPAVEVNHFADEDTKPGFVSRTRTTPGMPTVPVPPPSRRKP